MNSLRNIAATFLILSFNPFVLSQVTDSHGGDFVVVSGTTTYESLPFIEIFSGEDDCSREFCTWVVAEWNGLNNASDDYECLVPPCTNTDTYVSFLTPPDTFSLDDENSVKVWQHWEGGHSGPQPPVARFYYSHPMNYSISLYSPLINIATFSDISVSFDMHLWAWDETEDDEFLHIEYCTGSGWETAMVHLADAPTAVSIPWGPNSFFVRGVRDLDTLQLRFRANGYHSFNLMGWYIDNVKVKAAPVLNTVNIYGPAGNPGGAKEGDEVTIDMISNTDLIVAPTVIVNSEFLTTTVGSGTNWSATKEITETDPEGPVLFSIDFMSADTIPGQTVRESTNDSKVIVDNFGPGDYDMNDNTPVGGNVESSVWNSTNTSLNVMLTLPRDSAVTTFETRIGWSRDYNNQEGRVTYLGPDNSSEDHHRLLDEMTLEVWVKVHSVDTYDGMVVYGKADNTDESGYGFVFFNGWRFFLVTNNMTTENEWESNPATSLQNNVWTHLAGTYNGSVVKLYKNGVIVDSLARTGAINYTHVDDEGLLIGEFYNYQTGSGGGSNYFDGQVSEVRLWNIARSQSKIAGFRSWTLKGDEPNLVGYWKMAEGTGTVLADETDNSNGTCPSPGWENDAPLTLIDPDLLDASYDSTALVGAKVKLRASVDGDDYIEFGEDNIITLSDLPPNQMTANTSANYVENISGFSEGSKLTFDTKLIDIAGNETIGTPSTDTLLVKQNLGTATNVSIASNYVDDPAYAKVGDSVTVSFTAPEEMDTPTATIQDSIATVELIDNDLNVYSASYKFIGGETNGQVTFEIIYKDLFGNPDTVTAVTDNSAVIYDDVKPTITLATTYSSNSYNTDWAKIGDTVFVRIDASERLRPGDNYMSATIFDKNADATLTSSNNDSTFTAYYVIKVQDHPCVEDFDSAATIIEFEFEFMDYAGNDTTETTPDNSKVKCDTTVPDADTTGTVVPTGGTVANRFWNNTNTGLSVTIPIADDLTLLGGMAQHYVRFNNGSEKLLGPPLNEFPTIDIDFTIDLTDTLFESIEGWASPGSAVFHSKIWDAAYNMTVLAPSASILIIDTLAPTLEDKEIFSTNDDDTRAILGDTVYVQFRGQYEGIDTVVATIGGQPIDGYDHVSDDTSRVWRKMTGAETEGVLPFSIAGGDTARNMSPTYTEVNDESSVDFSAAGPEVLFASIKSNSAYGDTLARPGDIISVEIRTDMPILLDSAAVIFSQIDTTQESLGNNQYLYSIEADTIDTVRIVQFSIDHTDLNGNEYDNINNSDITDTSYVRFDGTVPRFEDVTIISTGADPIVADSADTINLTFRIDEAISDSSVTILNNPANSITPLGNNTFRASYTVTGSEEEGEVSFDISVMDLAGNSASIDSTSDNSYVVYDQTPPSNFTVGQVISAGGDTVMPGYWNRENQNILVTVPIENNDNSLIDGAVQVLVSFDGSDTLEIGDAETITRIDTPKVITISDDDFEDSQHFAHGTTALFTARINDVAGYTTFGTASNDTLQIDIRTPVIDSIRIESSNNDSSKAKGGDTVFVKFLVQEDLMTDSGSTTILIAGVIANYIEVEDDIYNFFKKMDTSDVQGVVSFSIKPMDLAGNLGSVRNQSTDGSRVIYDYTPPFINHIYEGSFVEDKDYIPSKDSLRLGIDGGDLLSGLSGFNFSLGYEPGIDDVIDWKISTDGNVDILVADLSLSTQPLINDQRYYASARAIDFAGNESVIISGDGFLVDEDPPTKGTINDGFLDEGPEPDWTFDSTSLDVHWYGFKDDSISQGLIGSYELSVFYEDTGNTIEVLDWFTIDTLADSATITGLALQRNTEYFVKIRAVDMAGHKSDSGQTHVWGRPGLVRTDGIEFDNQPARIDTVMPSLNSYLDVLSSETIEFRFNKQLSFYKLSLDNTGADTIDYTDSFKNDSTVVEVNLSDTLLTADTLHFNFDSVTSLNRMVMAETITLYSTLWGDLDSNRALDVADVVRFNTLWPDIDLAPVVDSTEPPHYAPKLDSAANLEDLYIFSRMWNWYYETYIPTMLMISGNNVDVSATYSGGQLRIQLPENTSAGQIIFTDLNYGIINVSGSSSSAQNFVLVNEDSVIGVKAYTFATLGGSMDSVFSINMTLHTETDYNQNLQVRFYDQEGKEILAGTALLKITPVPARYALGQNYPNPFNPTTTIRFELPEDAHTRIAIYDLLGREIVLLENRPFHAGYHQVIWQGRDTYGNAVPSGMYFYRMEANAFSSTRKMVYLK